MFLFPLIYIGSFLLSLYHLSRHKVQGILLFLVFGLPIYTTTLSVCFLYNFRNYIPILQSFKELIILVLLGYLIYNYRTRIKLHLIDKLVIAFFLYTLLYALLPVGQYGLIDKLLALKSLSFFVFVYFTGRLFDPKKIVISQYFYYICIVAIFAAALLLYEVITYQHFQTFTGYADYNYYIYNQEPTGNYGLSWTFEIENGLKRFASFFATPLELSASTLLVLAVLAALYTRDNNKFKPDRLGIVVLLCNIFAVIFSLSRASFVSYFLMIYVYAFLTRMKYLIWLIHGSFVIAVIYILFFINKDLQEFIVSTLDFSNPSSLGHVLEWLDGIQAMISHPLGLGLGESGKIASALGQNVGGENQLIIIGVQAGIIALILYITVYVLLIKNAYRLFKSARGKERKVCLAVLLMRIGFIVPLMTSNFESYIYISYVSWFISGLFVHMISDKIETVNTGQSVNEVVA